jgi:hypothetical protein
MRIGFVAALVALPFVGAAPCAAATFFKLVPIVVQGAMDVTASAISNRSVITGHYTGANGVTGFILDGSKETDLPPSTACGGLAAAFPSAINKAGDVAGGLQYPCNYAFLWRNGAYAPAGAFPLGSGGTRPTLNDSGGETYNAFNSQGVYTSYAGTAGDMKAVRSAGTGMMLLGQNDMAKLGGAAYGLVGKTEQPALFFGHDGKYTYVGLAGAIACTGGFINDSGQLAGACLDSAGAWHAFVHGAGKYRHIILPRPPHELSVQAINATGRVVGFYTDPITGLQRVFFFNGKTVSLFGDYPGGDYLHLALNDAGVMVLSDVPASGASQSWRVVCKGTGC